MIKQQQQFIEIDNLDTANLTVDKYIKNGQVYNIFQIIKRRMFSSTIQQLRQSTFRQNRVGSSQHRKSKPESSLSIRQLQQSFLSQDSNNVDRRQMSEYLLKLPFCPYHHEPVKFLCVSSICHCSNYAICSQDECMKLHQNPGIDLIDIDTFNELIMGNCASLLLLGENIKKYFEKTKAKIIHDLELNIQKIEYLLANVYMNEVPILIRQKKISQITSAKLSAFITKDVFKNNPQQREKMELLRNQVATRIANMDRNLTKLHSSKEYDCVMLNDIVKSTNSMSALDYVNQIQVKHFESSIMQFKEEFQLVCKMLKENRAPVFQKITTIFRASEHQFKADKYHEAIDGRSPTITLIKTSNNKKFGAFLNCKISQIEDWICDATGLSFIFSLDREEVYKLKSQASNRLKTAFGGRQGPQIGSGCDIYIYDECNKYRKNGANLGGSFRLPHYLQFGTAKAKSYLAGEQNFLVEEYEVFALE